MTHKDRPKLPLFVLAAGAILLGAAALRHPVDLSHPASPPEPKSTSAEPPADAAANPETAPSAAAPSPEKAAEPKVETPSTKPEPSQIVKSEPEERPAVKVETPPVEFKTHAAAR